MSGDGHRDEGEDEGDPGVHLTESAGDDLEKRAIRIDRTRQRIDDQRIDALKCAVDRRLECHRAERERGDGGQRPSSIMARPQSQEHPLADADHDAKGEARHYRTERLSTHVHRTDGKEPSGAGERTYCSPR